MNFYPFLPNEALNSARLSNIYWNFSQIPTPLHSVQKLGQVEIEDDNGTYTQNLQTTPNPLKKDHRHEQNLIWTQEQNQLLFQYHQLLGCKWSEIVSKIPGKTFNDIKNHFYSLLRKGLRRINGILKQYKIKYKYRAIRERFLLKLSQAMEQKFNKKLGLSQHIISQSYSIRNWFLLMSDNNSQSVQNIEEFKNSFKQFLDFDFSFRKHKPVKSRDNGNLKKYYNKISETTEETKKKHSLEESQVTQTNRVSYRAIPSSNSQTNRLVLIVSICDGVKQDVQSDEKASIQNEPLQRFFSQHSCEQKKTTQLLESQKEVGPQIKILQIPDRNQI